MPQLYSSQCDKCDYKTSVSSGARMYVLNEANERIYCGHPGEDRKIAEVLNLPHNEVFAAMMGEDAKVSPETKKKMDERIGMEYLHICLDCAKENYLDIKKDENKCSFCNSLNVIHVGKLTDKSCPKCKQGTIKLIHIGQS